MKKVVFAVLMLASACTLTGCIGPWGPWGPGGGGPGGGGHGGGGGMYQGPGMR
ncbi:hypothetical protein [Kosakonia radicincitans]|uniref:hypothetical protein n=1 Tax=Kosakonia radicincitans TaxID=283686 RepID=UPI0005C2B249|nr:hypothetical protein [Kosakonia radicincitans]KIS43367.1 putative lipoprotein [Kosakonia radicincitans YD4]